MGPPPLASHEALARGALHVRDASRWRAPTGDVSRVGASVARVDTTEVYAMGACDAGGQTGEIPNADTIRIDVSPTGDIASDLWQTTTSMRGGPPLFKATVPESAVDHDAKASSSAIVARLASMSS